MEENEKPFACLTDGCNMRFTNEDHLTVHQKKHDMILNLGNGQKMNTFVADQTPTPTRFIRNCEEVGLFQDLQINPFDETFRKAVESGKMGNHSQFGDSLHLPMNTDDTLHTPHVFPFPSHSEDAHQYKPDDLTTPQQNKRKTSNDNLLASVSPESSARSESPNADLVIQPAESSIVQIPIASNQPQTHVAKTAQRQLHPLPRKRPSSSTEVALEGTQETLSIGNGMQLLLRMPNGKLVQLVQEKKQSPPVNVTPIPTPENGLALAKMKLKQALTNNGRVSTSAEPKTKTPIVRVEPASPSVSPQTTRKDSSQGSGEEGDDRKLKFRERNRAAAMRCREKRKTWVQELERRAEDMQATNQQLQGEVTALRAEVAQLKTLLLAHKNCPITQAMNQGQMINVSALPMETIQTCLLPTSQPSRIMYQPTATTSRQTASNSSLDDPSKSSPTFSKRQRLKVSTYKREGKSGESEASTTNGSVMQSVVVSNPVQSSSEPRIVGLSAGSVSSYVNIRHLLSACATNENNLNLEKCGAMLNSLENSDDDRSEASGSAPTLEGTESKVIKLNPNVSRFHHGEEIGGRDGRMSIREAIVVQGDDVDIDTEEIIIDS